jgi:hypothetical protein
MSVQYAADKVMELNQIHAEDKAQIIRKYWADHFKAALICHNLLSWHSQIVEWLKEEFQLSPSFPLPLLSNSIPPNNRTGVKQQVTFVQVHNG